MAKRSLSRITSTLSESIDRYRCRILQPTIFDFPPVYNGFLFVNNFFLFQRCQFGTDSNYDRGSGYQQSINSKSSWSLLSPSERAAWQALKYNQDLWEGKQQPAPGWKEWSQLNLEEKSIARNGLNIQSEREWNAAKPPCHKNNSSRHGHDISIPSLESLLMEEEKENKTNQRSKQSALVSAENERALRQQQGGSWGNMMYRGMKGLAPIVGPLIRLAGQRATRGHTAMGVGLSLLGSLVENVPTMVDSFSGILNVTGIDTLVYLDDSGSMAQGSNLIEGHRALSSLESRLKTATGDDHHDKRFLPTRIVKFGTVPTVLNPSEEDWSLSLTQAAWNGSSGGTYMWEMIQNDIQSKYRPAGGKLRIVVITDGHDTLSPPPYRGSRGFDPLMQTLLRQGYDIEWYIIMVGNEFSARDQNLYQSLCRATGGHSLALGAGSGWDESDHRVAQFLDAIEESGYQHLEGERHVRQQQYQLEAQSGQAEKFDWLPALSDGNDNDSKDKKNKKNKKSI